MKDEDFQPPDPDELAGIDPTGGLDDLLIFGSPATRRHFLKQVAGTSAAISLGPALIGLGTADAAEVAGTPGAANTPTVSVQLKINGKEHTLTLDPRTTLLDALREHLQLTGSKKGCDHGQCGACTVLVNGRRINSCLSLAVVHKGDEITTIEGLAIGEDLHPVQAAFLEHDGFQCGYCTPGQICSAVACIAEGHAKSDADIREWMSGNLCRCGAYPNIVAAVKEAQSKTPAKGS
jgi:xanthine dehydrogenase YagT iron-sulfur-binding subunit